MTYKELTREEVILPFTNDELTIQELSEVSGGSSIVHIVNWIVGKTTLKQSNRNPFSI